MPTISALPAGSAALAGAAVDDRGEFLTAHAVLYERPAIIAAHVRSVSRAMAWTSPRSTAAILLRRYPRLITELPHTFRRIMPGEGLRSAARAGERSRATAIRRSMRRCSAQRAHHDLRRHAACRASAPTSACGRSSRTEIRSAVSWTLCSASLRSRRALVLPSHGLPFRGIHGRSRSCARIMTRGSGNCARRARGLAARASWCRSCSAARSTSQPIFRHGRSHRPSQLSLHEGSVVRRHDANGIWRFAA